MTENEKKGPGRPSGRTLQGEKQKRHLYEVGLSLIKEEGFEKATIRKMAQMAGVSPGLFYKYFASKEELVLHLHEDLTSEMERRCEKISGKSWVDRSTQTLRLSLETLTPHRKALKALIPILVGSDQQNVFSGFSQFSRLRVEDLFMKAISESSHPPSKEMVEPMGRLTYNIHLAILLFWLLDKSSKQKASEELLKIYEKALRSLALGLKLGPIKSIVKRTDQAIQAGLIAPD